MERLPDDSAERDALPSYAQDFDDAAYAGALKPYGERNTIAEHQQEMLEVALLDRMGYSTSQIAEKLGTTPQGVYNILTRIKRRYNACIIAARRDIVARELAFLLDMRRMAYEGYLKAQEGYEREETETTIGGRDGGSARSLRAKEKKSGAEFLTVMLRTNERICRMLGIEEAAKAIVNVNVDKVSGMARLFLGGSAVYAQEADSVEQRLAKETNEQPR